MSLPKADEALDPLNPSPPLCERNGTGRALFLFSPLPLPFPTVPSCSSLH